MSRLLDPLVLFNSGYYRYPVSLSRGAWSRLPADVGLDAAQRQERSRWLSEIERRSKAPFASEVRGRYSDPGDAERLLLMIPRFGVFVERFFLRAIRPRLMETFASTKGDSSEVRRLVSEAWGHEVDCKTTSEAVRLITETIFEQVLLSLVSPQVTNAFAAWFDSNSPEKPCGLCRRTFRVIDLPEWVYFGSGGCDACCLGCPVVEQPVKRLLPDLVRGFVAVCGFLPPANADPLNYAFTSRLRDSGHWLDVFRAFGRMGGIKHAAKKLGGTWFKALAQSGCLPNGVLETARGIRCLARDGHECNSLDEQRIDDWLTEMGVPHEKEPYYPTHPVFNPDGKRRADWRVEDMFIEYFGLAGEDSYDRKTGEKMDLAAALGLKLVPVYPEHLQVLDERLSFFRSRTFSRHQ